MNLQSGLAEAIIVIMLGHLWCNNVRLFMV